MLLIFQRCWIPAQRLRDADRLGEVDSGDRLSIIKAAFDPSTGQGERVFKSLSPPLKKGEPFGKQPSYFPFFPASKKVFYILVALVFRWSSFRDSVDREFMQYLKCRSAESRR